MNPATIQMVQEHPDFSFYNLDTRLVYLQYNHGTTDKIWFYRVPFGSFFLLGMSGLILIGADKKMFLYLIASHAAILLISWLVLATDFTRFPHILDIPDFLSRYLAQLSSLGIITIAYMFTHEAKKKANQNF